MVARLLFVYKSQKTKGTINGCAHLSFKLPDSQGTKLNSLRLGSRWAV